MEQLTPVELQKREELRAKKPLVYEKVIKLNERFEKGIASPIVDIVYDYKCDFKCNHCLRTRLQKKEHKLTLETLKRFTDEADALGLCQLVLSGGEPLIFSNFDDVVKALQPDKFHIKLSTNGYHLTREYGARLRDLGIDKLSVSLDSMNEQEHDANRNKPGSYKKAVEALFIAKEFGLSPVISTVVTHQNCQDGGLVEMAEFATKNGFKLDVFLAKPLGEWEGRYDILITDEDYAYLYKLHQQYPVLFVDTFPSYGLERGCGAVKSTIHLTPYGDIFPCVYIQVSIGNIFEEPLQAILDRGMSIKHFGKFSSLCLSGRNMDFIKKVSAQTYSKKLPLKWSEVFSEEDFI